jgi:hypothetical protein
LAFLGDVCNPYRSDLDIEGDAVDEQLFPKRLVPFFAEAVSVRSDDREVAGLRLGVGEWDILFCAEDEILIVAC